MTTAHERTIIYKGVLISIEPFPEKNELGSYKLQYVLANLYPMVQKSTTYDFNLSLMFRSKVNMAAPPEKFNVEEHRTTIKFLHLQGKGAKQIPDEMSQSMGDGGPSYATDKHWVVDFKTGHFGAESEKPSGRRVSVL